MNAFEWLMQISIFLLVLALGCALFRIIKGPSLPDRIVALDLVAMSIAGIIAIYAIGANQPVFLDVLLVLAIVLFFGTVAFGRYLERTINGNNELG